MGDQKRVAPQPSQHRLDGLAFSIYSEAEVMMLIFMMKKMAMMVIRPGLDFCPGLPLGLWMLRLLGVQNCRNIRNPNGPDAAFIERWLLENLFDEEWCL